MSRISIPREIRERIAIQAKRRCGYCLTAEAIVVTPMELDHIVARALGGLTVEEKNLWLACSLCKDHKADRIAALDVISGEIVRLFNPRTQSWLEHFQWSAGGDLIIGLTPTGRATVSALNMNRACLVVARRAWVAVGWHPPTD